MSSATPQNARENNRAYEESDYDAIRAAYETAYVQLVNDLTACPETGPISIETVALLIGSLSESNMVIIKLPVTEELLRLDTLKYKVP